MSEKKRLMVQVLLPDLQVSQISETTEGIFSDAFYLVALDESVQNGAYQCGEAKRV